jgi:hypothetical protein
MANKKLSIGTLLITLIFGMAVVGCVSLSAADSALNGTWTAVGNDVLKLNNGKFELSTGGSIIIKGTYTTKAAGVTLTPTHVWGSTVNLDSKWYSKTELAALVGDNSDVKQLFGAWTGTVNSAKLTLTWNGLTDTYTKR